MYQRYLTLAQEAARMDDRVASEGYYQHAEHYFRIGNAGAAEAAGSGLHPDTTSLDGLEDL